MSPPGGEKPKPKENQQERPSQARPAAEKIEEATREHGEKLLTEAKIRLQNLEPEKKPGFAKLREKTEEEKDLLKLLQLLTPEEKLDLLKETLKERPETPEQKFFLLKVAFFQGIADRLAKKSRGEIDEMLGNAYLRKRLREKYKDRLLNPKLLSFLEGRQFLSEELKKPQRWFEENGRSLLAKIYALTSFDLNGVFPLEIKEILENYGVGQKLENLNDAKSIYNQYAIRISLLRREKQYQEAQDLMENLLNEEFQQGRKFLGKTWIDQIKVKVAKGKVFDLYLQNQAEWKKQGMTDAQIQEYYESLMKLEEEREINKRISEHIFDTKVKIPEAKQAIWNQYRDMLDPKSEWFNLKDETWDTIARELIINAPLIVASGGVAMLGRKALSTVTVRWLEKEGAKRLPLLWGKKIAEKTILSQVISGIGRGASALAIEGTLFEVTHGFFTADLLRSLPEWGKSILWSSITLGVFHGTGRFSERILKTTKLDGVIAKITNPSVREAAKTLLLKGHMEAATMLIVGAAQHGTYTGSLDQFFEDIGDEILHAYITVGALKISGKLAEKLTKKKGLGKEQEPLPYLYGFEHFVSVRVWYKAMDTTPSAQNVRQLGEGTYLAPDKYAAQHWGKEIHQFEVDMNGLLSTGNIEILDSMLKTKGYYDHETRQLLPKPNKEIVAKWSAGQFVIVDKTFVKDLGSTELSLETHYRSVFSETMPESLRTEGKKPEEVAGWIDEQGKIHYHSSYFERKFNVKLVQHEGKNVFEVDGREMGPVAFFGTQRGKEILKEMKQVKTHEVTHRLLEAANGLTQGNLEKKLIVYFESEKLAQKINTSGKITWRDIQEFLCRVADGSEKLEPAQLEKIVTIIRHQGDLENFSFESVRKLDTERLQFTSSAELVRSSADAMGYEEAFVYTVGSQVNIKRSDGRIQQAEVIGFDDQTGNVIVRWEERFEYSRDRLYIMNPHMAGDFRQGYMVNLPNGGKGKILGFNDQTGDIIVEYGLRRTCKRTELDTLNRHFAAESPDFQSRFARMASDPYAAERTKNILRDGVFELVTAREISGKRFYFGKVFDAGQRLEIIVFTEVNNKLEPRLFYRSISDGGWRVTPSLSETGSGAYKKGKGIHYVQETRPVEQVTAVLEDVMHQQDGKFPARKPSDQYFQWNWNVFREYGEEVSGYHSASLSDVTRYNPGDAKSYSREQHRQILDYFTTMRFPSGFIPDFTKAPLRQYRIEHTILGSSRIRVYQGRLDGRLIEWHMAADREGRVWIDAIRFPDAHVTSFGNYGEVIDSGILTSKPIEYDSQVFGYEGEGWVEAPAHIRSILPDYKDQTPMLESFLPIRLFRQATGIQRTGSARLP